jgi:hypothetical protein
MFFLLFLLDDRMIQKSQENTGLECGKFVAGQEMRERSVELWCCVVTTGVQPGEWVWCGLGEVRPAGHPVPRPSPPQQPALHLG